MIVCLGVCKTVLMTFYMEAFRCVIANHVGFSLIICWQMSENAEMNMYGSVHSM